jgi:hypothetical protein
VRSARGTTEVDEMGKRKDAIAAYGKASRELQETSAKSTDETPAYLAANAAKGRAYEQLPAGTKTAANLLHG